MLWGSYNAYSHPESERLFRLTPTYIKKWVYVDGKRFDEATIERLRALHRWDWPWEKLAENLAALQSGHLDELR